MYLVEFRHGRKGFDFTYAHNLDEAIDNLRRYSFYTDDNIDWSTLLVGDEAEARKKELWKKI